MGRIQTSIGLITGTDIAGTVDQLVALSGIPRDRLVSRNETLTEQQGSIAQLSASVIGVELSGNRLGDANLFRSRSTTSSNEEAVSVSTEASASIGKYQVTTQQVAQTHSVGSRLRFDSLDQPLGYSGTLDVRSGGRLEHAARLQDLNGGLGVQQGSIRITDRSGSTATIDLSKARSIEDVLDAINDNDSIQVRATADRDAITLTDLTGQTASHLRVAEVGDGETAVDLGLYGIDVAADSATGQDLTIANVEAFGGQRLDDLGIGRAANQDDLRLSFADGTTVDLDLDDENAPVETLDDLVDALNAADPTKLSAAIAETGDSIVLTDLTSGGNAFQIEDLNGAVVTDPLGMQPAAGNEIRSARQQQYLFGTSLDALAGGDGLGTLTELEITLRDGSNATVDVSGADTIQDVVAAINNSGLDLLVRLDDSRSGIRLRDVSGGSDQNFVVSSADDTATRLGIATDSTKTIVDGAFLGRSTVTRATRLEDLNQGFGVTPGSMRLTDSSGQSSALSLVTSGVETVGQLIDAVNGLSLGVEARLNDSGDGIAVIDTAGGSGRLTIQDSLGSVAASQLGLAGTSTTQTLDGESVEAIVGRDGLQVEINESDTLQSIVDKINASERYLRASIRSEPDGGYSLRMQSLQGGEAGRFSIDTSGFSLALETTAEGQDAKILLEDEAGVARQLSSADGVFADATTGLNLTVKTLSEEPVNIEVGENPDAAVNAVETFVEQYNKLVDKLNELTFFDAEAQTTGLLFGSTEALRIETGYQRLLSGVIRGAGEINTLGEVGLRLNETGKLELDSAKLTDRLSQSATDVEEFFTTEETGLADRLQSLADRLAGADGGMLITRTNALTSRIERNNERISQMEERLENERERLLNQFYTMESAISRVQDNQQYVDAIQPLQFGRASN